MFLWRMDGQSLVLFHVNGQRIISFVASMNNFFSFQNVLWLLLNPHQPLQMALDCPPTYLYTQHITGSCSIITHYHIVAFAHNIRLALPLSLHTTLYGPSYHPYIQYFMDPTQHSRYLYICCNSYFNFKFPVRWTSTTVYWWHMKWRRNGTWNSHNICVWYYFVI